MEYGASCEDIARVCHAHPVSSARRRIHFYFFLNLNFTFVFYLFLTDFLRSFPGGKHLCLARKGHQLLITNNGPLK